MQKNISRQFITIIFCIIAACAHRLDPYILSHLSHIQTLEKQDHAFCVDLKLDYDKTDNLKSALYWRCRLSMAKFRLYPNPHDEAMQRHNLEINDLLTKISLRLAQTPESVLMHQNKMMDERDHNQCLVMGFTLETQDQTKVDDYFACRKALLTERQLVPPYGNKQYLKYPNSSYNIGFVIDRRIDAEIARYNAAKEKYPTCVKYHLKGLDFKKCTASQDASRQCFSEIERKRFKKEGEEKIICQKEAYMRFPDEFLKDEDARKKEIARLKLNSDYYNKNSFAAIGVDDTQFDSDEERVVKEKAEAKKSRKDINSKQGLYSKYELTRLRQKYIFTCQKEADTKVEDYVDGLNRTCEEMAKFRALADE